MIDFVVRLVEEHVDAGGLIFWINSRTLAPYNCFTVECGSPGYFRSILFLHCVCTWAVTLIRLPCSIGSMLNSDVFRQIVSFNHAGRDIRLPWSIWRTEFSVKTFCIDLMGTGRFTCKNKHFACYQVPLIDHRLVLGLVGLVGRTLRVELFLVTVEQLYLLAVD